MPKAWLINKQQELVTEIFRNFCFVHRQLLEVCISGQNGNSVCFECLDKILGQETNQGPLWRLKDSAHLVFRSFADTPASGRSLDWALGYLFHECMKLKEDAYQLTNYVHWFDTWNTHNSQLPNEDTLNQDLKTIASQTAESIDREVQRIQSVLSLCRKLFITYLPHHRNNSLLARFFYDRLPHIQAVFGPQSDELLHALYGPDGENLTRLAANSLRQGGWAHEAKQALQKLKQPSLERP
ncbi:MAG: hypothetical protein KGY41_08095 [Desulfovermiculus sp.]|nr:hypothetical protein [Desulfovermiculus sp.]